MAAIVRCSIKCLRRSVLGLQIPSYFALILRAFSVIEGIALRVDPQYSIVQECFPYIARRLLTDNHPRTRAALQQLLYAVRSEFSLDK